jgi:hypothetical protein
MRTPENNFNILLIAAPKIIGVFPIVLSTLQLGAEGSARTRFSVGAPAT